MKSLTEKLNDAVSNELAKAEEIKMKDFDKLFTEVKNTGLLKKPVYDLPLVDTIGKTYYSSINKRQ